MNTLDELVARYGKTDAEMKALKKVADADKEQIKQLLVESDEDNWTAGGYTVKRVVSTTTTMNEGKLLQILKKQPLDIQQACIKTCEYVDMEELERAIYAGNISTDTLKEMDGCKESKTTVALRCTKAKEGK